MAIGLLALPAAEIATFVLVASEIGVLPALALLVVLSLAGLILLRRHGRAEIARLAGRAAVRESAATVADAASLLAGILLLVLGFITSVAGLVLLLPPLRRRLGATIRRAQEPATPRPGVVDLAPGEWRVEPPPGGSETRER